MKNGGTNNLIIDGNNLLYRIFWTNNFKLDEANSPGQVFLFLRSLKSYVDRFQPKEIYCTWDKKLEWPSTNFRNEVITVEYKANRDDDKFKNVHEYSEKIQEIIALLGVHNMYPLRMEADDLMAWLSTHLPGKNVIITTDKDLLQTISADTRIYSPIKKKEVTLQNFEEYTGVSKEQYLNYRAITGDKSDNIPGIPRYGLARFKKLEWPSTNFRNEVITVEYKANRDDDKFKDVHEYAEKIQEIISLLGVHNMFPLRMEADDLMAWLSAHLPGQSVIVTTDKDLLQTISVDTKIYSPIKKKIVTLQNFEEYTGVSKDQYLNYRAVTGDKSDNIPGIPKYGLARFKKLDLTKLTEEQQVIYERNLKLMDLSIGYDYYPDEVPIYEEQLKKCKTHKSNHNKFIEEAKKLNMWSVVRDYSSWRESFNNNENIINIIKKAIKKCKTEN